VLPQNLGVKERNATYTFFQKVNKHRAFLDTSFFFPKLFFSLILFSITVQLGKHFWPSWSFISGIRIDYLSPTLYLSDLIIIGLLLLAVRRKKVVKTEFRRVRKEFLLFAGFLLWIVIGIIFSPSPQVGGYFFVKLLEFSLVSYTVSQLLSLPRDLPFLTRILSLINCFFSSCCYRSISPSILPRRNFFTI
jgi:hypothetical protein